MPASECWELGFTFYETSHVKLCSDWREWCLNIDSDPRKMLTPQIFLLNGVFPLFFQDGSSSNLFIPSVGDSMFHLYFPDLVTRARILSHCDWIQGTPHAMGLHSTWLLYVPQSKIHIVVLLNSRHVFLHTTPWDYSQHLGNVQWPLLQHHKVSCYIYLVKLKYWWLFFWVPVFVWFVSFGIFETGSCTSQAGMELTV